MVTHLSFSDTREFWGTLIGGVLCSLMVSWALLQGGDSEFLCLSLVKMKHLGNVLSRGFPAVPFGWGIIPLTESSQGLLAKCDFVLDVTLLAFDDRAEFGD